MTNPQDAPRREAAWKFFRYVLAGVPEHLGVFVCEQSPETGWCNHEVTRDAQRAADLSAEIDARGSDAYFTPGLFPLNSSRRRIQDCSGIVGYWVDYDVEGSPGRDDTVKASGAPNLKSAKVIASRLAAPTILVRSGGGIHAYHLLREPLVFNDSGEKQAAANAVARWQEAHRQAARWHVDATHDLSRPLRVPGTHNHKTTRPRLVSSIRLETKRRPRYSTADLDSVTADVEIVSRVATPVRLGDFPELSDDRLTKFRGLSSFDRVWSGEQVFASKSERDLALMKEALRAGATGEEAAGIVGLKRADAKGRRHDYLEHTLAQARNQLDIDRQVDAVPHGWMRSAAELLAKPDPGPTPFVVDELIVERSICAIQGPYKVGKTWLVLELILALVGIRPALGQFSASKPVRVLAIFEESGEAALHRRVRALCDGHELDSRDRAFNSLYYAANARVQLLEKAWQDELIGRSREAKIDVIILDPFARITGEADENSKKEMAPVLNFLRRLRDETQATVIFVHHTGHGAQRLRGTSDLEAYWESKLTIDGKPMSNGPFTLSASHREAESATETRYRIEGSTDDRWVRLEPLSQGARPRADKRETLVSLVADTSGLTNREIVAKLHANRKNVTSDLEALEAQGRLQRRKNGNRKEWFLAASDEEAEGSSQAVGATRGSTLPLAVDSHDHDMNAAPESAGQAGAGRTDDANAPVPRANISGGKGAHRKRRDGGGKQ